MKRKCYALIALLLAVCMVLPMGVFVGADTPAGPSLTASITGSIDADGKVLPADKVDTSNIRVAVGGSVTVSVAKPEDYTLEPVVGYNGGFTLSVSGTTFTVTGQYAATNTLTINAKNTKGETLTPLVLTFAVEEKKIIADTVEVFLQSHGTLSKTNSNEFSPGETIHKDQFSIEWQYSDQLPAAHRKGDVRISTASNTMTDDGKLTIKGGDKALYYEFFCEDGTYYDCSFPILVTGKTIEGVTLSPKSNPTQFEDGAPITDKDVQNNITIKVKYEKETAVEIFGNYTLRFYNKVTDKVTDILNISTENIGDYTVYAVYDGVESNRVELSDIITVRTDTPKSFTMDVRNATKKDYIEGDTLDDFRGVTVTVSYQNSPDKTFKGDEIKSLNLYIHPFVYGEKNIIVEYGDLLTKVDVSYLNIARKGVVKIKAIDTNVQKKYAVGDKLDLTGLQIELTYNDGKTSRISYSDPKIECSPAHGSTITASMKKVMILYTGEDGSQLATSFDLTISTDKKLTSADLAWGSNGKMEYFVGEAFKPSGFRVTLFFNDGTKENLALDSSKLTVTYSVENSEYKSASNIPSFTRAQSGYVNAKVSYGSYGKTDLQIPVTVTKRPNLKSITAVCTKVNEYGTRQGYFVGDIPSVKDFTITVYYDDNSTRTFVVEADDSSFSARTPYTYTRKSDGVTYTVKLNPTKIEEDTKKITVSYNEYVTVGTKTNKTVETDVEINVTVPDCVLKHYISFRNYETTAYESIHDALDNVKEGDEIELYRDVTLTGDEPQSKSFEIDLNGHTLTMIRGEIYVRSNASSSTKITFSNSSRDDAHIRYTANEDDDVIIAYNKEYVIDRFSKNDGRYDITITSVKNGKVTGPTEVIHGHDAKFTITPDEGYEIAAIKVNNKTYKAASDNTLLIEDVREKLTVTVTFQEKAWQNPFTDVSKYATYYKAVQFVYEEGLFNGTSATKFEPDTTMTRAMFVTVLGRLAGVNVNNYKTSSFSDVATGQWYSEYVEWASSIGLVEGYGNGKFGPNDSITHAQMYVLMERYADIIEGKTTTASGTSISANDVRDIPDWAYEAVEYAAKNDFLVVSSYKLTPNDNAKRSELAMLLQKFCKNILGY